MKKKSSEFSEQIDGEDWSIRNEKTLHFLGKFFRDQNLLRLNIVKYAPGESRYNMIERSWANQTPHMAHLILDPERKIWLTMDKNKTPAERMNFDVLREGFGKVMDAMQHYRFGEGTPSSKNRNQFNTEKERELYAEWKFTNYVSC